MRLKLLCGLFFIFLAFLAGCAMNPEAKAAADRRKAERIAYLAQLSVQGCDGEKVDSVGLLKSRVEDIKLKYGFFMDDDEERILEQCYNVVSVDKFFDRFLSFRDINPDTPVNEFKEIIDKRIQDIENEVLFTDPLSPGISFSNNGGMKGDLAQVYLLKGNPHDKARPYMSTIRIADLMAWIYWDVNQRPLYVFLFYNKGYGFRLFKNHMGISSDIGWIEILKEIAKFYPTSPEDYQELYDELQRIDLDFVFRFALQRFSYYDDVRIDDALAPPSPGEITGRNLQPKIIGNPDIPDDVKIIPNSYFATIPLKFILHDSDRNYSSELSLDYLDIDWEDKDQFVTAGFDLVISFTDIQTRKVKSFYSGVRINVKKEEHELRTAETDKEKRVLNIGLNELVNHSDGNGANALISDIIHSLSPGNYEIKVRLINQRTLKSGELFDYITVG